MALLARMLNPVSREEWEAGKALGLSPAEIMHEIIIPAAKPGLLYPAELSQDDSLNKQETGWQGLYKSGEVKDA